MNYFNFKGFLILIIILLHCYLIVIIFNFPASYYTKEKTEAWPYLQIAKMSHPRR